MQEEYENDPEVENHIAAILSFREKKGIEKQGLFEAKKGWSYWLSLGCVRSKSTHYIPGQDNSKKGSEEEHEPGVLNLKLSPIKGVKVDKGSTHSPQKKSPNMGNLAMNMMKSQSIENLIGQD